MPRPSSDCRSSTLSLEALCALDRILALGIDDEPDLGRTITYMRARETLGRIALSSPWQVAESSAAAIRRRVSAVWMTSDPRRLEVLADRFVEEVLRRLDRHGRDWAT